MTKMKPSGAAPRTLRSDDEILAFLAEAPVDDEPVTEEDIRAHHDALQEYRSGETVERRKGQTRLATTVGE